MKKVKKTNYIYYCARLAALCDLCQTSAICCVYMFNSPQWNPSGIALNITVNVSRIVTSGFQLKIILPLLMQKACK